MPARTPRDTHGINFVAETTRQGCRDLKCFDFPYDFQSLPTASSGLKMRYKMLIELLRFQCRRIVSPSAPASPRDASILGSISHDMAPLAVGRLQEDVRFYIATGGHGAALKTPSNDRRRKTICCCLLATFCVLLDGPSRNEGRCYRGFQD